MIKKIVSILLICLIIFATAACTNSNKSVKYNKVYSDAFDFSTEINSEAQNPPGKNIYIFNNEKEWSEFTSTHLNNLKISDLDFNNKKVLLCLR